MAPIAPGSWGARFVGSHILITEPSGPNDPVDTIPLAWKDIRFDAIDVLFISPFFVKKDDFSFVLGDGSELNARFEWVIRAARTKNPKIKIIAEQFWKGSEDTGFKSFHGNQGNMKKYADSVAGFIGQWNSKTLPALTGSGQVSGRIDGYDVDVEADTLASDTPKVLTAVRSSLDALSSKQKGARFSVSMTPAWTEFLDESVASSCDYINMQNYDGGRSTSPKDYLHAIRGLRKEQLIWGFTTEMPWLNTIENFAMVKQKLSEVVDGKIAGVYTWRMNSDNHNYENIFQVWMYNLVHKASLPGPSEESVVDKFWARGGRVGDNLVQPQDLK